MKFAFALVLVALCATTVLAIPQQDVDWECPSCKYVVKYAAELLEQGHTAKQIETKIHDECLAVFKTIAPYVCELLDNEVENIIAFLESGDAPEVVCDKLKLCKKSADAVPQDVDFNCPACKAVVYYIQGLIFEGNTTEQIKTFVHNFCMKQFGRWMPSVCDIIDANVEAMVADLKSGTLPQNVCRNKGICPAAMMEVVKADPPVWECIACKYVVKYAADLLEQGQTAKQIKEKIHTECLAVFQTIAPYICDLLDNEVDNIVAFIESGDAPAVVCQKIKLCKAAPAADPINFVCPACKAAVNYIQGLLVQGDSVDQIKALVSSFCLSTFGKWGESVCPLVNNQVETIITLLKDGDLPSKVCGLVGLCTAADELPQIDMDWECPACKYVVKYAADLLEQGQTAKQIENKIHDECMVVFKTIAPYVCELLDNEVDNIVAFVESGDAPAVVCDKLKLCKN